jgi:hypothetical protein
MALIDRSHGTQDHEPKNLDMAPDKVKTKRYCAKCGSFCRILSIATLISFTQIFFGKDEFRTMSSGEDRLHIADVFVSYAYSEGTRADSSRNLIFFLRHGVRALPGERSILYGIVVNGICSSFACENPSQVVAENERYIVRKWNRINVGFDFGAHAFAIRSLMSENQFFQYYIFLNCGVVGPILPPYMPQNFHWTSAFVDKFRDNVGLVGTSIVCLPASDIGGFGPSVEGFAFSLSRRALEVVLLHGTSFRSHKNKVSAILDGEYALTDVVLKYGFSIDSLLKAYEGIDWSDHTNWHCNNYKHPSRRDTYFGISIHPFEVVFHKVTWGCQNRSSDAPENFAVMDKETELYIKWTADAALRKVA